MIIINFLFKGYNYKKVQVISRFQRVKMNKRICLGKILLILVLIKTM